jgi:predicted transcriptional regulator
MPGPEGSLTAAQHEILEVVWQSEPAGATVAEIWQSIAAGREVGRTTILNLVDRLEKRGWLVRSQPKPVRYRAALDREQTAALLARGFVDDFFGGSANHLVMSLLGAKKLKPEEIDELRSLLDSASATRTKKGK